MFTKEKPHRRYAEAYGISFWNNGVASNEDNATEAVLNCGSPAQPVRFEFKLPGQRNELEKLEDALMKAFESGVYDGKKQVRDVLGIGPQR